MDELTRVLIYAFIYIPIHFGMAVRQRKFSVKNADFANLIGCHGNVSYEIAK